MREAKDTGLVFTNYFEPINEGAIAVHGTSAELTPVGRVFETYGRHARGELVNVTTNASSTEVDVVATITATTALNTTKAEKASRRLLVTLAGLDAVGWRQAAVRVGTPAGTVVAGSSAKVVTLRAQGFAPEADFEQASTTEVDVGPLGEVSVALPPFSVVQVEVEVAVEVGDI